MQLLGISQKYLRQISGISPAFISHISGVSQAYEGYLYFQKFAEISNLLLSQMPQSVGGIKNIPLVSWNFFSRTGI